MSNSLAFTPPGEFDPDKMTVESWVRKMKNYLGSLKEGYEPSLIAEFAFDRLSSPVQFWYEKVYLESKKKTRSAVSVDGLYAALEEKYGKRDLYASRDIFWNLPCDDVSAFLAHFAERARTSTLSQEELIYILTARLPTRASAELRKSPQSDLHSAMDLVKRVQEAGAGSSSRPVFFGKGGHSDFKGRDGVKDGNSGGKDKVGSTQFLGVISTSESPPLSGPIIAAVNGENTRTTLNFGVEENLIPWKYVRENRLSYSLGGPQEVTLPDGRAVESRATCEADVSHRGSTAKYSFRVVDGITFPVLGRPWKEATSLGLDDD